MIFPVMAFYRLPKQWGNDRRATCAGVGCFLFTRPDSPEWAERVGKYMLRPVLALERLTFLEPEGKVGYRWGRDGTGQETEVMDYMEFIARVTSHIPDKGQVMVRYYGLYANAQRGKVKKESQSPTALRIVEEELRRLPSKGWAALIRKPH